jgi:hypothetical protein
MKEPAMTSCPYCAKETPAGAICRHCGKEISFAQGIEVHYKDFKGSEMLDIKMATHAPQNDQKPVQKRTEISKNAPRLEKKLAGKKVVFFLSAGVVVILSALAWYYLLKFLMKF